MVMAEEKTLGERYADDILSNNAAMNHFSQCKDCIFRDKRVVGDKECGYNKCVCRIYGRISAMNTNETHPNFFPYTPIEHEDKPHGVYENTEPCEFYEKEKQKK